MWDERESKTNHESNVARQTWKEKARQASGEKRELDTEIVHLQLRLQVTITIVLVHGKKKITARAMRFFFIIYLNHKKNKKNPYSRA